MTTSGTSTFSLNVGEIINQAYRRIGVPPTAVDQEKLSAARVEVNAVFASWANRGPNGWAVDQQSVPLSIGVGVLILDPSTTEILDARITYNGIDRVIAPISRTDYAGMPNKAQPGPPTSFLFERKIPPTITLWPVPNAAGYTLTYYRSRQLQDAALTGGQTPDIPYLWMDALVWALAERLAYIYAPDKVVMVSPKARESYDFAAAQDTEEAPMTFAPDFSGYFNR